jgi:hypothetical protein
MSVVEKQSLSLVYAAARLIVLAAAVTSGFALGLAYSRRPPAARPAAPFSGPAYDPATAFPQVDRPREVDPRQPEPQAVEARFAAIRHDIDAISRQQAALGDWQAWQRETEPYRVALKARVDALKPIDPPRSPSPEARYEALAPLDELPLFEIDAKKNLNYLYDPASLDAFRKARPVVAAHRWFRQRGIDLIFVPVPKMTEVYLEHFLDPHPTDGVIAPHVRQTIYELLKEDVEVIDGTPLLRATRDADSEFLYNTCDTHWAPRGMRVLAKEIADRIVRYRFGTRARFALPIVTTTPGPYEIDGYLGGLDSLAGWAALSPEQQKRARAAQTTNLSAVNMHDGRPLPDDRTSPVVVIGHSYVPKFQEQLVKELNLLIHTRIAAGQSTSFFADFLREPEILAHCRVVVWITTEQHMTHFQPMPAPIMAALENRQ